MNSMGRQSSTPTTKSASPFPRATSGGQYETGNGSIGQMQQQQPVQVILSNGSTSGSSYKSTIESKVKLLSQNPTNMTYVRVSYVPSQESSIYG